MALLGVELCVLMRSNVPRPRFVSTRMADLGGAPLLSGLIKLSDIINCDNRVLTL